MNLTPELELYAKAWRNEDTYNNDFHAALGEAVNSLPENAKLKEHRDWVEQNQWGFGDRPFHYVWKMLVEAMPQTFDFLEIGVFKGQVLSLIALLAKETGKTAKITGVTTLQNTPDERCKYPQGDYLNWIHGAYKQFGLDFSNTKLVVGRSNDQHVLSHIGAFDYDCCYIDGNHDFSIVLQDLDNYSKRVRVGGFLVVDDASVGRLNVGNCWPGLDDVAAAVREYLDPHPSFKFLFACGHLNAFQKIKPQIGDGKA